MEQSDSTQDPKIYTNSKISASIQTTIARGAMESEGQKPMKAIDSAEGGREFQVNYVSSINDTSNNLILIIVISKSEGGRRSALAKEIPRNNERISRNSACSDF
jgi:predicted transcriptional regulator